MTPRGQALLAITLSLIFASGLCVALFVFRAGVTGWPAYNFRLMSALGCKCPKNALQEAGCTSEAT